MNFLVYMIGRARRNPGIRLSPRQATLSRAASLAAAGKFGDALLAYDYLGRGESLTPVDLLIRGQLHLMIGQAAEAQCDFFGGMERLVESTSLECKLEQAEQALCLGRYTQAARHIQRARTLIDLLLAAETGILAAQSLAPDGRFSPDAGKIPVALVRVARLDDGCLRLLARIHLATHLGHSLRRRQLREDLAPWAVSTSAIDGLINAEFDRLSQLIRTQRGHAEVHYRLGLMARAAGRWEAAETAFNRVLQLHPHHVSSAARLIATLRQTGRNANESTVAARAMLVPAETLAALGMFAQAAGEPRSFDRTTELLCVSHSGRIAPGQIRANLAFALAELDLLDEDHALWRESAPCV